VIVDQGPLTFRVRAAVNPQDDSRAHSGPFTVTRADLTAERTAHTSSIWSVEFKAQIRGVGEAIWGSAHAFLDDGVPEARGYNMSLDKKKAKLGDREVALKTGFSITEVALDLVDELFQADFRRVPRATHGGLEQDNLVLFQRAYAEAERASGGRLDEDQLAQIAIKKTPFGRARIARGYTRFEIDLVMDFVEVGGDFREVPAQVNVVAYRRAGR
jgi:hypothetical protein